MADFDKLLDTKGIILNYIEEKARSLFYSPTAPYDFSAWVQTAVLFEEIILPSKFFFQSNDSFFQLAQEVVEKAEADQCKVERYQLHNGKKVNIQIFNYTDTINRIKNWMRKNKS